MPAGAHPRAIIESQFLSIKSRIAAILPPDAAPLQRLVLSGGSSANAVIRQAAADVFGMRVFVAGKEGAAEGGAQLARFAWWRGQNGGAGTFQEMRAMDGEGARMKCVAEPDWERERVYAGFLLGEPRRDLDLACSVAPRLARSRRRRAAETSGCPSIFSCETLADGCRAMGSSLLLLLLLLLEITLSRRWW